MGIDIVEVTDEELIEITTLRVLETLRGEILTNATRLGPRNSAYLRDQLFIYTLQILQYKLLRHINRDVKKDIK